MFLNRKFAVDRRQRDVRKLFTAYRLVFLEKEYQFCYQHHISRRNISFAINITSIHKTRRLSKRSSSLKRIACMDPSSAMALDLTTIHLSDISHDINMLSPAVAIKQQRYITEDVEVSHRHHSKRLVETLYLLNAAEVLVSAAFFDFSCSMVYGIQIVVAYQLPNAKFDMALIGIHNDQFWRSITFLGIYAALGGVRFLSVFFFFRERFGFSTNCQLAFVLEKYWMDVQGKVIGCIILMLILNTVHQGRCFGYYSRCESNCSWH
ncbi:unnamed protein product [Phytophthora lilii]|uniref:Unnamed protein product n=1 Tax=Phytophthora lilii TaxID=2077276 RepID=A0A9W6TDS7_9STRA|nr:unnamed protein product [Phytophthora lilii]